MNGSFGNDADPRADLTLGQRIFHLGMLLRRAEFGPDKPPFGRGGHGPHTFQGQGRVLALLAMRSPIAQRELAYILGVRPQSLGEVLGKLESAGLITRDADPNDARARLVSITEAGKERAQEMEKRPQVDPLDVLSDEEQKQFLDLLQRVTSHLEEVVGHDADDVPGPFGGRPGRGRGRGGGFKGGRGGARRDCADHGGPRGMHGMRRVFSFPDLDGWR